MPTEEEIIKEVLKFDPGRKQSTPDEDAIIQEVLKFDPGRVGGTRQPKPSPIPGGTSPIDVRTGEVQKEYVPAEEPGASFGAMVKNVFVDDPKKQMEVYAAARGIPVSRYKFHNGEIIFRNKAGKWQRETGEGIIDVGMRAGAQLANPAVIGGIAGAIGGPKGAIAGAAGGELVRQAIGGAVYGDFASGLDNVRKVATEAALALGGEALGGVIKGAIHGHRLAKTGMKNAAWSVRVANFTPEDHFKAELIRNVAKQHNIDLPMHQVYDKESLTNLWMYLRKHPQTADVIKGVEDRISKQGDEAIQAFTRELRGPALEGSATIGEQAKQAATGAIKGAEGQRAYAVKPMYDEAFKEADLAGGIDLAPVIKQVDQLIESYNKGPAQKILQSIKQKLGTEEKVQIGKARLAKGWTASKEEAKGTWSFRSYVKKLGGIAVDDPKYRGEIRDAAKGARWGPGVVSSRAKGGNEMDELLAKIKEDHLWDGIINSEDDVLSALERNPTNTATWGGPSERKIMEAAEAQMPTSARGREWKEALAGRKQAEIPSSIFTPEKDLRKIQKALFEINDIIEGTAHEAAQISPSSKNVLSGELMSLKSQILEQIHRKAPTFVEANAKYAELSEPIDRLKNSVVGEISRLQKDATTAEATAKLFDMRNMKDPELLWRARASIEPQDPDLWRRMLGSYIRDTYDKLVIQEGDPISAFGKFERKLFGSPKQREIMEAAMGKDLYREFSGLMDVLKRATVGTKGQSMTAQFLAMEKEMVPVSGAKLYQFGAATKRAAVESILGNWNDAVLRGRQSQLLEAMLSDNAVKQMRNMKRLTPGSQKLIDALSVYTGMVIAPIGGEKAYKGIVGENRMPEMQ